MSGKATAKLLPLEGLRGIAAVIVMLGHLVRGLVPPDTEGLRPLRLLHQWVLNGGAAVTLFFVLSGFILSLPFARDRSKLKIAVALLKRWPRLAGLTTIACLFSFATITLSQDYYEQAGARSGNHWMASHFNSPLHGHNISLAEALRDGLYRVYLFGDGKFDSPLWTMRIELFGSFAIFLAAPLLFGLRSWALRLLAVAAAMLTVGTAFPATYFSDFLVGTVLAMLFAEGRMPELANWPAAAMGVLGIYLFCFSAAEDRQIYAPVKALMPRAELAHYVWAASAVLLIMLLLGNPSARRAFSGSWAVWLGLLSFPLYLLHVPIMLSAGAASFVRTADGWGTTPAVLLAAGVTVALTLLFAVPLAWVDKAWTRLLGRAAATLTRRAPAAMRLPAAD